MLNTQVTHLINKILDFSLLLAKRLLTGFLIETWYLKVKTYLFFTYTNLFVICSVQRSITWIEECVYQDQNKISVSKWGLILYITR